MSFADQLRRELADIPVKKPCCVKALNAGFLLCAGELTQKGISIRLQNEPAADLAEVTLERQFSVKPVREVSGACGHLYRTLTLSSPACRKLFLRLTEEGTGVDIALSASCEGCRSAFLRGTFLAAGTVNDPHKSYHLEWVLPGTARIPILADALAGWGYPPRTVTRQKGVGIYYKDSTCVEDLVTLMGSHSIIYEFLNSRIERDIRNNENRATNCVAKNIEKTVSATARQLAAINKLTENGRLYVLPEPLRQTAEVRYRYPDATLDELRLLHDPSISRSGLNHRLRKILEAAEED